MENFKISNAAEAFLKKEQHDFFINNKWVRTDSPKTIDIVNPANDSIVGKISVATAEDVKNAITSGKRAFQNKVWRDMSPIKREQLLHNLADLMQDHLIPMAEILTIENGKL